MEEHYETDREFVESLLTCEKDFMLDLLENGSTWENAKNLLAKQNETFGKPVVVKETKFKSGVVGKYYDWIASEPEPEPEP